MYPLNRNRRRRRQGPKVPQPNPDPRRLRRHVAEQIAQLIAAFTFFGAFVVCPLVYMLMRHQRSIAEVIHRSPNLELLQRLEEVERELRDFKTMQYDRILREDERHALTREQ